MKFKGVKEIRLLSSDLLSGSVLACRSLDLDIGEQVGKRDALLAFLENFACGKWALV